ncbi:MAG: hypothetical protein OXP73_08310 [Chloroflexota bacterium]|nr:hypothetical protein [Chloroflexota bacterium]
MSFLEFLSDVIGATAWPLLAGFAIFIFRRPIISVIESLKRVTYKDFAIEFGPKLKEVQEGASKKIETPPQIDRDVLEVSSVNPRGAIIDAWITVKRAIVEVARKRGMSIDPAQRRSIVRLERSLLEAEVLDQALGSMLRDLRSTRNAAAHRPDFIITSEAAQQYASAAYSVVAALQEVSMNRNP